MKTKTNLWLLVCTFVLCLGVMVTGVYSALSANLKLGGTLGFNMHNALIEVSGTISNIAKTDDNWASAYLDTKTIERVVFGGENTTTTNLNIGELYFHKLNSSSAYDIIFEITFKNLSEKSIKATLPMPQVGANVTLLHNDDTNGYVNFTNSYQTVVAKGNSFTIKFALQLDDISNISQNISFVWNNLTFEEYESLVKYDEAKNYYYIEMGTNPYRNDEPLRWFAYAQRKTDGTVEYIPNSVEPTSNNTYYFISELVFKTEDTNDTGSGGLPYQNTLTTGTAGSATVTGTSYSASDYAVSNIRKYLNGETVKNGYTTSGGNSSNQVFSESGTQVTIDFYNIRTSDVYINNITPIALSELYDGPYDCGNEVDKLWLISDDDSNFILQQYGQIAESTNYIESQNKGTKTFSWFVRPIDCNGANRMISGIIYVDRDETLSNTVITVYSKLGVRPAFQITIP